MEILWPRLLPKFQTVSVFPLPPPSPEWISWRPLREIVTSPLLASGMWSATAQKQPSGQPVGPPQEHWFLQRGNQLHLVDTTAETACQSAQDTLATRMATVRTVSRSTFSLKCKPVVLSFYWINTTAWMLLRKTTCGLSSFRKSPDGAHLLYVGTLRVNSVTILLRL